MKKDNERKKYIRMLALSAAEGDEISRKELNRILEADDKKRLLDRAKNGNRKKVKVRVIFANGDEVVCESILQTARMLNVHPSNVSNHLFHETADREGRMFEYVEEENNE